MNHDTSDRAALLFKRVYQRVVDEIGFLADSDVPLPSSTLLQRKEPRWWNRPALALGGTALVVLVAVGLVALLPIGGGRDIDAGTGTVVEQPQVPTTQTAPPETTPPDSTTTTQVDLPETTAPTPTTTTAGGLDLTGVQWVTIGFDGLRTDEGALIWSTGGRFEKAVARDRSGGLVFVDESDLWWFTAGAAEPRLVASDVPRRAVEVIGSDGAAVVALGFGERTYVRLSDGITVGDPGGAVTTDAEGNEVWSAANGWSVWIDGPVLAVAEEGTPTVVESPARLKVTNAEGAVVIDSVIGTDTEPWARVHDFDGQLLIVSRGPIEPATPEETFLVIDLDCDTCTSTFKATATTASLVEADSDWNGPAQFSEASLALTS